MFKHLLISFTLLLSACSAIPPKTGHNVCSVFSEQPEWYYAAELASRRWQVPVTVLMAIMYHESGFVADAKPPRPWLLGIIPWFRSSSAYGYAQAKDETWSDYLAATHNPDKDRDDFADAIDFIAWYCRLSQRKLKIAENDAKRLYLAYHEGHSGYLHKTFMRKPWLIRYAEKVATTSTQFQHQLTTCKLQTG